MEIVIVAAIFAGVVLGLIWRGRIVTLIVAAVCVGILAGAMVAKWPTAQSMFSSFWAFVWVTLSLVGFFGFLVAPVVMGAIAAFWLRRRASK